MRGEQGTDKRISESAFAGDTGAADPGLAAALRAHAVHAGRLPEVLAALHTARVLAPVVAVLGETATAESGLTVDKRADIALPLLVAGDGARGVPVFSDLEAMARWDPAARPVPVEAARAAAVVLAEQAEGLLLDIAGPHPATLGLAEVRGLLAGRGRVPAYADETLRVLLHQALAGIPEVVGGWLGPWPGADGRLTVRLAPGVAPEEVAPRLVAALPGQVRSLGVRGLDVAVLADVESAPVTDGLTRPVLTRPADP